MTKFIAATYAPMHKDQCLNLGLIGKYGEFLKKNHIDGAFVNGSTGDFVSLKISERKELLETWCTDKPKGFKVIAHVGDNSVKAAQEMAVHAADKADAIAAIAPFYFKPRSMEVLLEYCSLLAKSAPEIPFYYYHIPVLTGVDFPMDSFVKRAVELIPNFGGVKFTHANLMDYGRCKTSVSALDVFFGVDEMLVNSLLYSPKGWVGSTYNHLAPLYKEIVSLHAKGDLGQAVALQDKAIAFVQFLDGMAGFNGAGKSFMRYFNLDMGPSRFPHNTLSISQFDESVRHFDHIGLSEFLSIGM